MIASINQKIDLRTAVLFALPDKPRGFLRQNTQDAECPFDLGNVILADLLKCKPLPSSPLPVIICDTPHVRIFPGIIFYKTQKKLRIIIR